ncbi:hypothetical protein C6I21_05910 [Alkalicoccus urumqiensis]|uniref:DUF3846 domain-containing protein n=2 Tax=Alkalicoccus urumqiensis TaxID=1548213 RepID=A0A2P6MJ73_ALKUR|nr:hypothetical protein C6I21_05910 [Alkalicoccus urumqiensis]
MTILYLQDKNNGFEKRDMDNFNIDAITGLVEGPPEAIYLPENIVLWKNPRAALLNQEKKLVLQHEGELNDTIHGNIVITGTDGTKTIALNDDQINWVNQNLTETESDGETLHALPY